MKMLSKAEIKYGNVMESPIKLQTFQRVNMGMLDFSDYAKVNKRLPNKIYCNKIIMEDLCKVFNDLVRTKLINEIISYDGCFNPRYIRGLEHKKILSNHAFGTALDFNASQNPLGRSREECIAAGLKPFTTQFIQVWGEYNFLSGEKFRRKDLMHFEYNKF
jgi:hypothetical protein